MASATMGLRRRVPVNNPTASHHPAPSKRSRSENNNNPSHGNLNSLGARDDQPAAKKSRSGLAARTNANAASANTAEGGHGKRNGSKSRGKSPLQSSQPVAVTVASPACTNVNVNVNVGHVSEADISGGFNVLTPSPWSVPTSLCPMPPTIPYMATFVGNATNLNKNSSVSYLDISNMTSGSLSGTAPVSAGAPVSSSGSGAASSVTVSSVMSPANGKMNGFGSNCGKTENKNGSNNSNGCSSIPFPGVVPSPGIPYVGKLAQPEPSPVKFQNDSMYNAYQPWVIKTYGDLAKTKTITIKKYGRILRTLRGEEVNSAENSKFRFWVKSKGFHIGQPEGYDAKPADRIIGRHAVTSPGLDPPLYVPTQLPHNKALSGAEGTVPGRVYKKVAIVENFFDIIHAVHVDLEGRPGKHAGQKRTYRTITETYAFLPREAVTRFLLGCTECQRRPRSPSPSPNNLANQSQSAAVAAAANIVANASEITPVSRTPRSPTPAVALSATPAQSSPRPREASNPPESKSLFSYRHPKQQQQQHLTQQHVGQQHHQHVHRHPGVEKMNHCGNNNTSSNNSNNIASTPTNTSIIPNKNNNNNNKETEVDHQNQSQHQHHHYHHHHHQEKDTISSKPAKKDKPQLIPKENKEKEKEKEEKYNPLSISNLLKKEPTNFTSTTTGNLSPTASTTATTPNTDIALESRRTPESDRGSSRSSASSKRKRMLPEGRTPSPLPGPIARPWSPGIDLSKDTPVDYSLPITTTYLKHQQKMIAEKNKATMAAIALEEVQRKCREEEELLKSNAVGGVGVGESISLERDQYSPAGLIDTNLSLLATIQHLHCQVMMALTERLRPSGLPTSLMLPPPPTILPIHHHHHHHLPHGFIRDMSIPAALAYNHS